MPDDMASVAASLSVAQKRSLLVKAAKQGAPSIRAQPVVHFL